MFKLRAAAAPRIPFDILERYDAFREVQRKLQMTVFNSVDKKTFAAAGNALGVLHADELVLAHAEQASVVMDFAIYNVLNEWGENKVQEFFRKNPARLGTLEALVARSMTAARHGVFRIEDSLPGLGILCFDILRREQFIMLNRGLSISVCPGLGIASRVLPFSDGIFVSTCADLALDDTTMSDLQRAIRDSFRSVNYDGDEDPTTAALMSTIVIKSGLASSIIPTYDDDDILPGLLREVTGMFGEAEESEELGRRSSAVGRQDACTTMARQALPSVGRNSRCPCGSNRKFKHCCGALA